jgi:hypothetical protein
VTRAFLDGKRRLEVAERQGFGGRLLEDAGHVDCGPGDAMGPGDFDPRKARCSCTRGDPLCSCP